MNHETVFNMLWSFKVNTSEHSLVLKELYFSDKGLYFAYLYGMWQVNIAKAKVRS